MEGAKGNGRVRKEKETTTRKKKKKKKEKSGRRKTVRPGKRNRDRPRVARSLHPLASSPRWCRWCFSMQRTMHFPLKAYGREAVAGETLCGAVSFVREECLFIRLPRQWQPPRLPPRAQFSCRSISIFLARSHFVLSISYPACNAPALPASHPPLPPAAEMATSLQTSRLHNSSRYHERQRERERESNRETHPLALTAKKISLLLAASALSSGDFRFHQRFVFIDRWSSAAIACGRFTERRSRLWGEILLRCTSICF